MDLSSREGFVGRVIHDDVSVIERKVKAKKPPPKMVLFRASEEFIKEIDEAAEAKGVSRNEAMMQLLDFALAAERGKPKKRPADK